MFKLITSYRYFWFVFAIAFYSLAIVTQHKRYRLMESGHGKATGDFGKIFIYSGLGLLNLLLLIISIFGHIFHK